MLPVIEESPKACLACMLEECIILHDKLRMDAEGFGKKSILEIQQDNQKKIDSMLRLEKLANQLKQKFGGAPEDQEAKTLIQKLREILVSCDGLIKKNSRIVQACIEEARGICQKINAASDMGTVYDQRGNTRE